MKSTPLLLLLLLAAGVACAVVLLLAGRSRPTPSNSPVATPRRVLRQIDDDAKHRSAAAQAPSRRAPSRESAWHIWRHAPRPSPLYEMWRNDADADPAKDSDACERIYRDSTRHVCAISM